MVSSPEFGDFFERLAFWWLEKKPASNSNSKKEAEINKKWYLLCFILLILCLSNKDENNTCQKLYNGLRDTCKSILQYNTWWIHYPDDINILKPFNTFVEKIVPNNDPSIYDLVFLKEQESFIPEQKTKLYDYFKLQV